MKYTLFQDIGKELIFYGIYNTSVDMWDGKDIICLARKRFFETGTAQKKRSTIKTENGLYSYSYNIADGSNIRYKKSRGTQIAERSVDVSGGYCIETFDRFRAPFKRTYYNDDHSWRETEYYSPLDRSVNMNIRPLYENGSTYITVRKYELYAQAIDILYVFSPEFVETHLAGRLKVSFEKIDRLVALSPGAVCSECQRMMQEK